MRVPFFLLCAAAVVAAAAPPLEAQDWAAAANSDSILRALIAEALARNPGLRERQAALQAAAQRIGPAGALPDPELETGVMDLVLPQFAFSRSEFTEADVRLSQEFPWPGTLGARTGVARAGQARARAEVGTMRRELTGVMAAAYYRLRYVVTALETVRRQRRLLEAAVQLSTTRYATGSAPQSDPLQAKLARDRLASEEFALEGDYTAALAAVNALRDRPAGDSVLVAPLDLAALRAALQPLPPSDSLVAAAVAAHPELAGRRAAVEQATQMIRVERFSGRPDFSLSLTYGYRSAIAGVSRPDFFSAFLGLRLPVWAARKQHRLVDAARGDSAAADAALRERELTLGREVVETRARGGRAATPDAARGWHPAGRPRHGRVRRGLLSGWADGVPDRACRRGRAVPSRGRDRGRRG